MNFQKYFPYFRKAILSTISFWGYYALQLFVSAFVVVIYTNSDTAFEGLHASYLPVTAVLCLIALYPYSYDTYIGDFIACGRYFDSLGERDSFSLKEEFLLRIRDVEFIVSRAVWAFWTLVVMGFVPMLVCVAITTFAELMVLRYWFSCRSRRESVVKKKRPYAIYLLGRIARWNLIVFGCTFLVAIVKLSIGSIWTLVSKILFVAIIAVAAFMVFLFFYRRVRAVKVQRRLVKKLSAVCRENGLRLKLPNGIYTALLRQKVQYFTLEHRHIRFNIALVPTILRKTPLYFLGDGVIQRVHTFYFFKIDLFSKDKFIEYKLPKPQDGEKNIILLSPIPRQFFIGPPGNPAEGDNSSEVDGALVYSGTALCNYINRILSEEHIYHKESTDISF